MRLLIPLLFFFLFPLPASAYEAPFGLRWGMSTEQVKTLVGKYSQAEPRADRPGISIIHFGAAPKTPARTALITALFSADVGLVKLVWQSEEIDNDVYGIKGKSFYSQIKNIIKEKYTSGDSKETEIVGVKLYNEADEFYQCLKYAGCGAWSLFRRPDSGGIIAVQLRGVRRGVGYVAVSYESPQFSAAMDAAEKRGASKDKKAF